MKTILQQWKTERNFQTVDVVQVENIAKKAKTPYRWSKILLHKNFKMILACNVCRTTKLSLMWFHENIAKIQEIKKVREMR